MKNSKDLPINLENVFKALHKTYIQKNADYNDSFYKTFQKWGILGVIPRVDDKFGRVEKLIVDRNQVKDEGLIDTLLDLSCYTAMIAMFLINEDIENGFNLKEKLKSMNFDIKDIEK